MACQTNFFLRIEMGPTIFENWVMETENWVMRIDEPNSPLTTLPNKPYFSKNPSLYFSPN